ncbi:MAG: hypothetical protein GZ091_09315 [Paludibacter sp.]|nr:hypothetical protein [Paludibacter sp.]
MKTIYTKTFHISQNKPNASDDNAGTELYPYKTINIAAQLLEQGERVNIHQGIARYGLYFAWSSLDSGKLYYKVGKQCGH